MNTFFAKTVLLFSSFLIINSSFAQEVELPEVTIPQLPKTGAIVHDFVPPGWGIELSKSGDLGGDGSKKDYLLLLKMQDQHNILHNNGCELDTNPRMLVFLLARNSGYYLAGQNSALIPRPDQFCNGDDPIDGVTGGGLFIGGENGREGVLELGIFGSSIGHISFAFDWLGDGSEDWTRYAVYLVNRISDVRHRYDDPMQSELVHIDYLKQRATCLEIEYNEDGTEDIISEKTNRFISEEGEDTPLIRLENVGNAYDFYWARHCE